MVLRNVSGANLCQVSVDIVDSRIERPDHDPLRRVNIRCLQFSGEPAVFFSLTQELFWSNSRHGFTPQESTIVRRK